MINANQNVVRTDILTALFGKGIPSNFVAFTQKTCAWDEAKVAAFEEEANKFMKNVPKGKDWWQHARDVGKDVGFPHVPDSMCEIKGECKHNYPSFVIEDLKKLLKLMLSIPA